MKQFAILIALISYCNCYGQLQYDKTKISIETQQVVTKIENINELMDIAVGYAGIRPDQFNNFIDLQKTATKNELIELTNYPNAVVRCYAFWALSYDSTLNLFPVVLKHLSDTVRVKTQFGII